MADGDGAVLKDRNIQQRTRGVGVADTELVKDAGLSARWRARPVWTLIAGAIIPTPPMTGWTST